VDVGHHLGDALALDGVRIAFVVYGGGRPDQVVSFTGDRSSTATDKYKADTLQLLAGLNLKAAGMGYPAMLDNAFASARTALLGGGQGGGAAAAAAAAAAGRRGAHHVPIAFAVFVSGGVFESAPGALAAELAKLDGLASSTHGGVVSRVVVDVGHAPQFSGGSGVSGSGFGTDSGLVEQLLQQQVNANTQERTFLGQIASPIAGPTRVIEAQCSANAKVADDSKFITAFDAAVTSACRSATTEPNTSTSTSASSASSTSTTPAPTPSANNACMDDPSCAVFRDVVCGETRVGEECNALVLANPMCSSPSTQDVCPAMCGMCIPV